MESYSTMKLMFKKLSVVAFWFSIKEKYPQLSERLFKYPSFQFYISERLDFPYNLLFPFLIQKILITHLSKITLQSLIIFEYVKVYWDQRKNHLLLVSTYLKGNIHKVCTHTGKYDEVYMWPANPKIFTICPFKEQISWPLVYRKAHRVMVQVYWELLHTWERPENTPLSTASREKRLERLSAGQGWQREKKPPEFYEFQWNTRILEWQRPITGP